MEAEKNYILEQQLPNMEVTEAERRHICEATGNKTMISALMKHIAMGEFRASSDW